MYYILILHVIRIYSVSTIASAEHSSYFPPFTARSRNLPDELKLNFQCSGVGEIACSSTQGGVVTSGGGFSNSNLRERDVSCVMSLLCVSVGELVCVSLCVCVSVCECVCLRVCMPHPNTSDPTSP